ncbi:MAG: HEAT repeat domain-containing protein [Proteobacteria bacterium]|nr:HEAT repeat domain-containing protein [Pseudomonadota bacterium]
MRSLGSGPRVKQKVQIALACVAFMGLSLWASWPKREPSWDGKTVSEWLVELAPVKSTARSGANSRLEMVRAHTERQRQEERGQAAIHALGERAVPYVLAMLEEAPSRPQWQETGAKKLGWKLPEPPSREIRTQRAALAFAALGNNARSALPKLGHMLHDTNTMSDAALCLGNIGSSGVPLLLSGLASSNEILREACIAHIGLRGTNASAAAPAVLAAVADPNPKIARAAAFIYPGIEPDKHKLVATLLQWAQSNAVSVHSLIMAMNTVGYYRRPHGPEVQPLIAALVRLAVDPDENVQAGAFSALARFGELAAPAKATARAALQSSSSYVRMSACQLLGSLRNEPEVLVPLLVKLAQDDAHENVRYAALHAAAAFGEAALPFCGLMSEQVDKTIREQAEEAKLLKSVAPR